MSESAKRSTIYLDPDLHRALRLKAIHTGRSMSDLVNETIRMAFREDQEDLSAFDERVREPEMTYEALLKDLKAHGKNITSLSKNPWPKIFGRFPRKMSIAS